MVVALKTKGVGFKGLATYLEMGRASEPKPDRIEWVEPRNLSTPDPATAARIMRATANHNDNVADGKAKPVEHLSISWDHGDKPTKAQMVEVADRVIRSAGLERNQALIIAHNDTKHAHIHIFVNRVDPETLRVTPDKHDYWPIEQALRQAEREFGWRETPGHHWRYPDQQRPAPDQSPSKIDRQQIEAKQRPFTDIVRQTARQDFLESRSWGELHGRLAAKGLRLEPVGKVGFVVTDGIERCKASEVDRTASRGALEKRLGSYEPQRHEPGRPERAEEQGRGLDQKRSGEGCRPDAGNPGRPEHESPSDGPRDAGDKQRAEKHPAPDQEQRDTPTTGAAAGGAGHRDPGRDGERLRDEGPKWWKPRVEQPPPLNEALERLEQFDQLTARADRAAAEATKTDKEIRSLEGKEKWGERMKADTLQKLSQVYRDPQKAFDRIKTEMEQHGPGRTSGKLERNPEAFGKLHGWRIAGGILTKQPFTILASKERREARSNVQDASRAMRMYAGAERSVKAATASKPALVQMRDAAKAEAQQLRAEKGVGLRWERIRDVERGIKAAAVMPEMRAALTPQRRQLLEQIEKDQRARLAKLNQQRGRQQPNQGTQARRGKDQSQGPTRDSPRPRRDAPTHEQ